MGATLARAFHHVVVLCSFAVATELLNQYESDGVNYWLSRSTFVPMRNSSYGQIQIKPRMFLQFELFWYDLVANGSRYENIFRIGHRVLNTSDCEQYAYRYPGLYVDSLTRTLLIAISDTFDCHGLHYSDVDLPLTPHTSYSFSMQFTESTVVVLLDAIPIYTANRVGITPNHTMYSFVDVIISDALHSAANCTIRNMRIISYQRTLSSPPTRSPSPSPTLAPSFAISTLPNLDNLSDSSPTSQVEEPSDSNMTILWVFDGETVWYLILSIFAACIVVMIVCCVICYRYSILLTKSKLLSPAKQDQVTQHSNHMLYAVETVTIMPAPQLTAETSNTSVSHVAAANDSHAMDVEERRSAIKIVQPMYGRQRSEGVVQQPREEEEQHAESSNSDSNESMYDPEVGSPADGTTKT